MHAKSLVCKMLGDVSKPRWKGCVFVDACLFLPVFQTQWQGCAGRIWKVCLVFARRAIHLCCRAWWGWNAQIWWYRYLPFSETILSILYLIKIDIFPIHKKEKHTQHFGTPFAAEKDCSIGCQGCWDAAEWLAGLPSISRWIHSFEGGGPFGTRWMELDDIWWWFIWMMELMISGFWLHLFSSTIHRVGHHQFLVWLVSPIQLCLWWFWASSADSRDVNRHSPDVRCASPTNSDRTEVSAAFWEYRKLPAFFVHFSKGEKKTATDPAVA